MSIPVTCECGYEFKVKDEQAGRKVRCPECNEAVPVPSASRGKEPAESRGLSKADLQDVYLPTFEVEDLSPKQAEKFSRHELVPFSVPLAILFHFLTLGIFTTIFCGLKHSRLPLIKQDDFTAGKGIGFLFIPFFNFYWVFIFWLRLVDRINFQFRLRGEPDAVPRGLALTSCILIFIPYLGGAINYFILVPIMLSKIQGANNRLAAGDQFDDEDDDDR